MAFDDSDRDPRRRMIHTRREYGGWSADSGAVRIFPLPVHDESEARAERFDFTGNEPGSLFDHPSGQPRRRHR